MFPIFGIIILIGGVLFGISSYISYFVTCSYGELSIKEWKGTKKAVIVGLIWISTLAMTFGVCAISYFVFKRIGGWLAEEALLNSVFVATVYLPISMCCLGTYAKKLRKRLDKEKAEQTGKIIAEPKSLHNDDE